MNIIMYLFKAFAIFFIANIGIGLITHVREKNLNSVVILPRLFLNISAISYMIFHLPIIAYLGTNDYSKPEMIILFTIFIILCFLLFLACINWRIEYGDEVFKYRTMFRHTLIYKYTDVINIKRLKSGDIIIKVKKRWLIIDQYAVGQDFFIKKVTTYAQEKHFN